MKKMRQIIQKGDGMNLYKWFLYHHCPFHSIWVVSYRNKELGFNLFTINLFLEFDFTNRYISWHSHSVTANVVILLALLTQWLHSKPEHFKSSMCRFFLGGRVMTGHSRIRLLWGHSGLHWNVWKAGGWQESAKLTHLVRLVYGTVEVVSKSEFNKLCCGSHSTGLSAQLLCIWYIGGRRKADVLYSI